MKSIKKISAIALCIAMLAALCACGSKTSGQTAKTDDKVYTVKISNVWADDNPIVVSENWFAEQLKERSNGKLDATVYSNGQLASGDKEGIEICANGTVQVSSSTLWTISTLCGDSLLNEQLCEMPFLFSDSADAYNFIDKTPTGQEIVATANKTLGVGMGGAFLQHTEGIITNKPITKLADLKGMKLRTSGGVNCDNMFKKFGASPLAMAFGEVYTALQQGTVDGGYSSVGNFWYQKFYEVGKGVVVLPMYTNLTVPLYNEAFVNSLPEDLRKVWDECWADFIVKVREAIDNDSEACIKNLAEKIDVLNPQGAAAEEWIDAAQQSWTDAVNLMGKENFIKAMGEMGKDVPDQYK